MSLSLTFLGANHTVTGSSTLFEANGKRVLVDCGMVQERDLQSRNFDPFPVPPASLHAVLLTHAHLDHCGLLPKLVKDGFAGRIYATRATTEIAKIVLLDSAKVQAEDLAFKEKRHTREGRSSPHPYAPLYTAQDVEKTMLAFTPLDFLERFSPAPGISGQFHVAGHILGAAMIRLEAGAGDEARTVLFSGDVGRWNMPLMRDPTLFTQADYVICESTYGDRDHEPDTATDDSLARIIRETVEAGGNIVIPSFAVERTQDLLYRLSALLRDRKIAPIRVFVDSPMAIAVTDVFRRFKNLMDEATLDRISRGDLPCEFPGLTMTRTADESKAINGLIESSIIIAGSGMCTAGRIKHHLRNNLGRPESTILFVGYQAKNTLGRTLQGGAKETRLFGETVLVKARIASLGGMSGHADRGELVRWLTMLKQTPRLLFAIHGETESSEAFARYVEEKLRWKTKVPEYKETVQLT